MPKDIVILMIPYIPYNCHPHTFPNNILFFVQSYNVKLWKVLLSTILVNWIYPRPNVRLVPNLASHQIAEKHMWIDSSIIPNITHILFPDVIPLLINLSFVATILIKTRQEKCWALGNALHFQSFANWSLSSTLFLL